MFTTQFDVESHEADYLVLVLSRELPAGKDVAVISKRFSIVEGNATITIVTSDPLTLAQRQFLTSCGFRLSVKYRE